MGQDRKPARGAPGTTRNRGTAPNRRACGALARGPQNDAGDMRIGTVCQQVGVLCESRSRQTHVEWGFADEGAQRRRIRPAELRKDSVLNPYNHFALRTRTGIRLVAALLALGVGARSQALKDLQTPASPLVLKSQGSFYLGGEKVDQTQGQLGFGPAGGHITVNQMYVRYMVPPAAEKNAAVVMVHGMTLTGKSWETTPDGRMGWDEYFVRHGHAVYVPDQVSRGRSGFSQAAFNDVRAGKADREQQSVMRRFSDELNWPNFRFGAKPGEPFADERFPVAYVDELSKQSIPDLNGTLPTANPSFRALAELAAELKHTVLMGHSQGGIFPLEAALVNPSGVKGMVLVEPGSCPATYTEQQIRVLAGIPTLVVFGDHLDQITGVETTPAWKLRYDQCQAYIQRIRGAGGKAEMLYPPDRGIHGNSHMIMQDNNSLQIADLILAWIKKSVGQQAAHASRGTN